MHQLPVTSQLHSMSCLIILICFVGGGFVGFFFSFFSFPEMYSEVALSCELNKLILDADFETKEMKT